MKEKDRLTYTTILHQVRDDLDLDNDEYILADCIYKFQENPVVPGWCFAKREQLKEIIKCSRRKIQMMIKRLASLELIEINPDTHYLRTTSKWSQAVHFRRSQITPKSSTGRGGAKFAPHEAGASAQLETPIKRGAKFAGGVQKSPKGGAKMTGPSYNNIYNKNLSKGSSRLGSNLYTRISKDDFKRLSETLKNLTGKISFEEILETLIDKSIEFIFIENDSRIRKYYKKNILDIDKSAVIESVLTEYKPNEKDKTFHVVEKIYTLTCEKLALKLSQ